MEAGTVNISMVRSTQAGMAESFNGEAASTVRSAPQHFRDQQLCWEATSPDIPYYV